MIGGAFDTEVAGEPASLRECAQWLRATLRGDVVDAGERQSRARREAGMGWEGAAGEAYRDVGAAALSVVDDHAERVRRAADAVADVADRLRALQDTMADLRVRARDGRLVVLGTVVSRPVDLGQTRVPGVGGGPGGPAGDEAVLFARLQQEAHDARTAYADWVEGHLARARADAGTRGDLDRVLRGLEGVGADGGPEPGRLLLAGGPTGEPSLVSTSRGADVLVARDGGAGSSGPAEGRPMVVSTPRGADVLVDRVRGGDGDEHTVVTSRPRIRTHVLERPLG